MADAFIYDHVRTPRGRGKQDGSLHEVTALNLAAGVLASLRDRNELDTTQVDDVVLGCVDPVGEAGGDIARAAALTAGYGDSVPGVQINRFCASGLDAVNFAAAQVMAGQHDMAIGGGVESMSRIGIGRVRRRLADGSLDRGRHLLPAAGHLGRPDRHQVRFYPRRRRRLCGGEPEARRSRLGGGPLQEVRRPGEGHQRPHHPGQGRAHAADHRPCSRSAQLQPSFVQMGELGGFDAVAVQAHPEVEAVDPRASRRQLVGHRRRRRRRAASATRRPGAAPA